jgi:integrase
MATRRLTDEYVRSLPFPAPKDGKDTYTRYPDVGRGAVAGLWLRVTSGGARSWVLVARFPSGKRVDGRHNPTARKIGGWPGMRLPEAREIALDWNRDIARGIDPQEKAEEEARAKQAEREARLREEARRRAGTFANVAEDYIVRVTAKQRTGHDAARVIRNDLVSRWGNKPIADISKTDVITMIEDIAGRGQYAAAAAYKVARAIFNWCLEREDPKHPKLGIVGNPCTHIKLDKLIGERRARQHTLSEQEIALLWQATEGDPLTGYPVNQYVRLLLILGVRRRELSQATHGEFENLDDPDKAIWRLAHTRTKNQEPREIPLPPLAVDIINALPRFTAPYLFSTTDGRTPVTNFTRLKEEIDRKITTLNDGAPIRPWRFHDLRRSMRSNLSAIRTISPLVAELMIGHSAKSGILAVYDQHQYADEQRAGFRAWEAKLRSIVEPPPDDVTDESPPDNIVHLERRA